MARGGNQIRSMMDEGQTRRRGRLHFFVDIYSELSRVTWPSRDVAARLTLLVIGISVFMGLFLGIFWDTVFNQLVERFLLEEGQ